MADEAISVEDIYLEAEDRMEKAVEFLHGEFRAVRTGRASVALVENLKVDYYGTSTPLKQLANLSAPEASLVVIKPFDVSCIKPSRIMRQLPILPLPPPLPPRPD